MTALAIPRRHGTIICMPSRKPVRHDRDEHQYQIGQRLQLAIEEIMCREQISKTEFAKRTHTTLGKLNNWIRGDNYPDPLFVWHLHDLFGVTADWLYLEKLPGLPASLRKRIEGGESDTREGASVGPRRRPQMRRPDQN